MGPVQSTRDSRSTLQGRAGALWARAGSYSGGPTTTPSGQPGWPEQSSCHPEGTSGGGAPLATDATSRSAALRRRLSRGDQHGSCQRDKAPGARLSISATPMSPRLVDLRVSPEGYWRPRGSTQLAANFDLRTGPRRSTVVSVKTAQNGPKWPFSTPRACCKTGKCPLIAFVWDQSGLSGWWTPVQRRSCAYGPFRRIVVVTCTNQRSPGFGACPYGTGRGGEAHRSSRAVRYIAWHSSQLGVRLAAHGVCVTR